MLYQNFCFIFYYLTQLDVVAPRPGIVNENHDVTVNQTATKKPLIDRENPCSLFSTPRSFMQLVSLASI